MSGNAGKTVAEILKEKGSIKNAPLEPGSPSWDDIMEVPWEEIEEKAKRGEPGYKTFKKLLSAGEYSR